jgi:hypothetical protein
VIDWRRYPFQLVPGDAQLEFPAAEGTHRDHESDTWYLAGITSMVSCVRLSMHYLMENPVSYSEYSTISATLCVQTKPRLLDERGTG